ncbi:MAG: lysylphosphatidylglycerol synthase transmembrane domain-containing protein [Pseudomonadota bacterium]
MNQPHSHPERFDLDDRPDLRGRRLVLFTVLFASLTFLGVYAIYSQIAGHALAWDNRLLDPRFLFISLVLLLVYFAADGLRLWFVLRALGESIALSEMARLVFLNIFVSNITPLATGGGVAQVWFMRRRGVAVGTALSATTIRTVLAVLFIFSATPVLLVLLPGAQQAITSDTLIHTLAVSLVVYVGFFAVLLTRPDWLLRPLLLLLSLLHRLRLLGTQRHRRWRHRLVRESRRFARGFGRYFRGAWFDIAGSLLFTALFLLTLFSFPALLLWTLGYGIDYWLVIGRMIMTTFVMYFSPTPGASGIAEGVFGQFFRDIVDPSHLVLVTVAWRALTIYLGMLIGLLVTQRELSRPPRGSLA